MRNSNCLDARTIARYQNVSCSGIENEKTFPGRGFMLYRNLITMEYTRKMRKFVESLPSRDRYRCGCNTAIEPEICRPTDRWFYSELPETMKILEQKMKDLLATGGFSRGENRFEIQSGEFSGINPWSYPWQYINDWCEWMDSMKSQHFRVWITKWTGLPGHQGRHGWHQDGGPIHKFFLIIRKEDPKHANLKMMPFDVFNRCKPKVDDAEYRSKGVCDILEMALSLN